MAERMGVQLYLSMAYGLPSDSLVGEWFFADTLFGDQIPSEEDYLSKILSCFTTDQKLMAALLEARKFRHDFLDTCARKIQALHPRVVGFTTTFHQTCACLAVARRLKELPDPPQIIFGGANCEGEMGQQLIRAFPWIDYVCTREGDTAFPDFLERLLMDGDSSPVPGILKQGMSAELTSPAVVSDLDSLPFPDYSDYFTSLTLSSVGSDIHPNLLIETSRGCWWGAKHHCTFCGLNGDTMAFRSKSAGRVLEELEFLSRTYGIKRIDCVDNILDLRHVSTLFPKLIESELDLELFYEVKANLRYDQLATLRKAGVHSIQPGIESFSSEVLRLMKKGCTGLQNVQLLRWCEELGIDVAWNILSGFPGESPSEYERMAELVPLLVHLVPPSSCTPIRLDRFSPFFTKPESFRLQRLRPTCAYYYVFPLGRRELARLAYFFDFDYADGMKPADYLRSLRQEVDRWRQSRFLQPEARPVLDARQEDEAIVITDSRACAVSPSHRLMGTSASIYLLCDAARSFAALARELSHQADPAEIRYELQQLMSAKLLVEMDGQYLSLAVMRNRAARKGVNHPYGYVQIEEATASESLLRPV
jgi:ribosomal peptide maturation radical SAM protein 1